MQPFDLHMHSYMSDGTLAPEEVVSLAASLGVRLIALTDHDTCTGVERAQAEGRLQGVKVIAGMELDVEYPEELHMLGLCFDPSCPEIAEYERWRAACRAERNDAILKKLDALGVPASRYMEHSHFNDTRLHIARAIIAAGYAVDIKDAFARYLKNGAPAYVKGVRISMANAVSLIKAAGGLSVIAHPCKMQADMHALIAELAGLGLNGIEAFYPLSTDGQRELFISLAAQYGLLITCGSDFHGAHRAVSIGSAWRNVPALEPAYELFLHK